MADITNHSAPAVDDGNRDQSQLESCVPKASERLNCIPAAEDSSREEKNDVHDSGDAVHGTLGTGSPLS